MEILHQTIPENLVNSISYDTLYTVKVYVEQGVQTGGFLEAVLSNNLSESIARADHQSLKDLKSTLQLIYNYTPASCWGSKEKVKEWLDPNGKAAMVRNLKGFNV